MSEETFTPAAKMSDGQLAVVVHAVASSASHLAKSYLDEAAARLDARWRADQPLRQILSGISRVNGDA